jgi:hypothetical protein
MGKERQRTPLPSEDNYSLLIATSHALYPPLYLAGPIITYQDYAWQLRGEPPYLYPRPSSSTASLQSMVDTSSLPPYVPWKNVGFMLRYACRLAADLLCIELVTHYMYFNSLAVHRVGPWLRQYGLEYGAQEVGLTAWWVLTFMWLKFAVIWRFFRQVETCSPMGTLGGCPLHGRNCMLFECSSTLSLNLNIFAVVVGHNVRSVTHVVLGRRCINKHPHMCISILGLRLGARGPSLQKTCCAVLQTTTT